MGEKESPTTKMKHKMTKKKKKLDPRGPRPPWTPPRFVLEPNYQWMLQIDIKFTDKDKEMMILTSLIASFEHLVITLCWGKKTLEFKEISKALIDHYHQKQNLDESSGEGLVDEWLFGLILGLVFGFVFRLLFRLVCSWSNRLELMYDLKPLGLGLLSELSSRIVA